MGIAKKRNSGLLERLKGDKVIWVILFGLIFISLLTISSSTSQLAISEHGSRIDYAVKQMVTICIGMTALLLIYYFCNVGVFWFFSRYCFCLSAFLLLWLNLHLKIPKVFEAAPINSAWRVIKVFGLQLHVYEFVKVFMIMYLAWAMQALKDGKTTLAKKLAKKLQFEWLGTEAGERYFYIIFPIAFVCLMVAGGGFSSTLIIGVILFLTAIIAGLEKKYICQMILIGVAGASLIFGTYYISGGKLFTRVETVISRLENRDPLKELHAAKRGSLQFQNILDDNMQEISAKIAISEGGLFGKGPGNSTQRYVVAVMYEDYMYAFIVEEYGLLFSIFIMILYGSLIARGAVIVRYCDNRYVRTLIAGLILLISGQALFHMLVNADALFFHTGQTLPMISYGTSSFLAMSIAFGVILSVSRMAQDKILEENRQKELAAAAENGTTEDSEAENEPKTEE